MIVAFKHLAHDNSLLDIVTSLISGSKYAHVQIIFSNGQVGGAWIGIGEVALRPINDVITYPFLYDYVKINDNEIDEIMTYDFIEQRLGEKFSIIGAFTAKENEWH